MDRSGTPRGARPDPASGQLRHRAVRGPLLRDRFPRRTPRLFRQHRRRQAARHQRLAPAYGTGRIPCRRRRRELAKRAAANRCGAGRMRWPLPRDDPEGRCGALRRPARAGRSCRPPRLVADAPAPGRSPAQALPVQGRGRRHARSAGHLRPGADQTIFCDGTARQPPPAHATMDSRCAMACCGSRPAISIPAPAAQTPATSLRCCSNCAN